MQLRRGLRLINFKGVASVILRPIANLLFVKSKFCRIHEIYSPRKFCAIRYIRPRQGDKPHPIPMRQEELPPPQISKECPIQAYVVIVFLQQVNDATQNCPARGITLVASCSFPMSDSKSWRQHHLFPNQPCNNSCSCPTFSWGSLSTPSDESILNPRNTNRVVGPSHLSSANRTPNSPETDLTISKLRAHSIVPGATNTMLLFR